MADRATSTAFPPIFDGHNDTVLAWAAGKRTFLERSDQGHIDLPRAREGGLGGGFFACFARSTNDGIDPTASAAALEVAMRRFSDPATMPPTPDQPQAVTQITNLAGRLFRAERDARGEAKIVRTAGELTECLQNGTFAMLFHIEGAEAIDTDLYVLDLLYRAGLRSLGLVWSRPNAFGHGVPFKVNHSPDTGPGLTDAGKALVRACNELRVMVDLSHLNEKGFWDVAKLSQAPLVATHSNAHALTPSTRNLTDRQLDAVKDSDGMVGVNFAVGFLTRAGGNTVVRDPNTPMSTIADHFDYLIERVGIDRVGFGTDFDGATIPNEVKDAAGLPKVMALLRERGYDETALRKLAWENWVRVLRLTWGA